MRTPTSALFGLGILVSSIAGCAVPRHASSDLQSESPPTVVTTASRLTPKQQYDTSLDPSWQRPLHDETRSQRDGFDVSNPRVDSFVTRFQTSLRGFFTIALSRSGRYVPRMSSILRREGLPQELAYLPLIESGFRPHAVSRAGAVGPWQLIPGTGRRYGLRIDRYVDERCDPVKSTEAAAHYLKDLYEMFGDWHLSLAAYNTGENNISRILERGRADDFWEMSERGYLYQETRDFVPGFLAALQIAEAPEAYGFDSPQREFLHYDQVMINRPLPLSTVAKLSGASTDSIKELNPALQRGVVPPDGYTVRLPRGTREAFEVAYADLAQSELQARHTAAARASRGHHDAPHRARRGNTVASIGKRHKVSVQALASANHLRHASTLRSGKTLRVPQLAARDEAPLVTARRKGRSQILD